MPANTILSFMPLEILSCPLTSSSDPGTPVPMPTLSELVNNLTVAPSSIQPPPIVPPPVTAVDCTVPSGNLMPPVVECTIPATCSFSVGFVVPMPTLPPPKIVILSVSAVKKCIGTEPVVPSVERE